MTFVVNFVRIYRRQLSYGLLTLLLLGVSAAAVSRISPYHAGQKTSYVRAKVVAVSSTSLADIGPSQHIKSQLLDGPARGQTTNVDRSIGVGDAGYHRIPVGSTIVLERGSGEAVYSYVSRWFIPGAVTLFAVLLVLVIAIGVWRGIASVLGLAISILILAVYVIPQIVAGRSVFITCIVGALAITLASVYVAHGVSKRTTIAMGASLLCLAAVVGLTALATYLVGTSEIIDETSVGILYATRPIDLAGLLSGGVVIAALGPILDITTGQAAVIDELATANPKYTTSHLFRRGMSVGREHIAALINTLALVYVGVALPAIVTSVLYQQTASYHQIPLLITLNTEIIAEEVVRIVVPSIAILLALPLTTWLAAYVLPRWTPAVSQRYKEWLTNWK